MSDNLNVEFIEEYKRLDNFCSDMFDIRHGGVTAYIDAMKSSRPNDRCKYTEWEKDFNELKRLRSIRNKIVHEPDGLSYPLCSESDIKSVISFHDRLLNRTDPLCDSYGLAGNRTGYPNESYFIDSDEERSENTNNQNSHALKITCVIEFFVIIGLLFALLLK